MRFTPRRLLRLGFALALGLGAVTCIDNTAPTPTETPSLASPGLFRTPTGLVSATAPEIFVGAGDIASCSKTDDSKTAAILDTIPGSVFVLGDNVYDKGTTSEFANCYGPTWGRHKARTYPSAGNHEYNTSGAAPYYAYFGAAAGNPGEGYYSFDLGAWHVIVLNSNIAKTATSPQVQWLKAELAAHQNLCTVAYFHHPLYSSTSGSGTGGTTYNSVRPFYDELYAGGVDLVLTGHRHAYERLAKLRPDGSKDVTYGTRHMIVGTGGIGGGSGTNPHPGTELYEGDTRGVLKLYLYEDSYAWKFIPIAGKTFSDSGSTACHGRPPAGTGVVSPSLSTLGATPTAIPVSNGSSTSTITVSARDGAGSPMIGAIVTFSASGTGNTLTPSPAVTDSSGVATSALSSTTVGTKTVSAKIAGVSISRKPTVTVTPGPAATLAFSVQPSRANLGAMISPAVKVEIRDQFGNRITTATDNVTVALGNNSAGGTLAGTLAVAAVGGIATFSNLSVDSAGTGYTLGARAAGLSEATSNGFDITVPPPSVSASLSTVEASPGAIPAGSGSSSITVTVKDAASGAPISGVNVTLSATAGGIVGQPTVPTDANGVATGSLTSTSAGPKTITAVAAGVTLNQKPVVEVTPGPPDAGQSSVTASPGTIQVETGISTITVTVKDAYGNRLSGAEVMLDAPDANVTQPSAPTNGNGVTTGTLGIPEAGPRLVSATASLAGNVIQIAQTATVNGTTDPTATIEHALLTSGSSTANQKVYTTAPISPAPNTLVTVAVLGHRSQTPASVPTVSGGGMTGWIEVITRSFDPLGGPLKSLTIYRAMSASPGSGPITISFPGTMSNAQWMVSQWSGVDQSGVNGAGAIVQTSSTLADASNGVAVTLAPFEHPNNVAYGVFGVNSQVPAITPGAGFAEIAEQPSNESPSADLEAEWAVDRSTVDASWTNLRGGGIGLEIRARTGP
jgi:hypothetical protein